MAYGSKVGEKGLPYYEIRSQKDSVNLAATKVVKWQKPLLVALVILGVVGLGVAGTGLASLGAHQGWWVAGGLSTLSQTSAIVMIAVGGGGGGIALLTIAIVRLRRNN